MGMCILYSPGAMDLLTLLACFPTGGVCVCVCVRVYMCICTNIDICMCTNIQSLFCHHPTGLYASQIRPLYPDFDAHKAILCPTYNPQTHTQDVSSFQVCICVFVSVCECVHESYIIYCHITPHIPTQAEAK
jgi:hypothetical protein